MKYVKHLLVLVIFLNFLPNGSAENMKIIKLTKPKLKGNVSLEEAISKRRSVRNFSSEKISEKDISQLLWACQGLTSSLGLRAVPSAGALYPLEIYVAKEDGLYHYLPKGHELEKKSDKDLRSKLKAASLNQGYVEKAPLVIIICAIYERVTSRYGERGKMYTDVEVGHAAQNIHLEAVSLGLASVPVGAFSESEVSKILKLQGKEKAIYIIPIGYKEK